MQGPFLRKYGVEATFNFQLFEIDGVDLRVDAAHAAGDTVVMKDEGAEASTDNGFTDEGRGYSIVLTATEMTAARIVIYVVDQTGPKAWLDTTVVIETYGNASAQHAFDLDTATVNLSSTTETQIDNIEADTNELQTDDYPTSIAAVKAETALIVADTNELQTDDYPTSIAAIKAETALIVADTDELQADWANTGRLDTIVDSILADTNELQADDYPTSIAAIKAETALIVADTNELQTDDYPTSIAAVKAETALIVADTDELQTDWANDGRLDLILDAAGGAGDPWITAIPGAYGAGTAGLLLGTTIPTNIAAIKAETALIVADTNELQTDDYPTSIAAIKAETALIVADTNELQTDDYPTSIAAVKAETALIVADTDELQTDWANDGRLDLILDAASAPSAATVADAVWNELGTGHVDAGKAGQQLWTDLDAVLADTNELQTDDYPTSIAAVKADTAAILVDTSTTLEADLDAILADTNELQTDWADGGRLDLLLDAANTAGAGAITFTYTLTSSVDADPIADADVWVTSDEAGAIILASGHTDQNGEVVFYLDAGTVYVWRQKSGWDFSNPDTEVVS